MQLNVDTGITGTVLAGIMAAGIVAGLLAETAYVPYTALAACGLVWYFLCRRTAPRPVIGYAVLGACILLAVSAYSDTKHIIHQPDMAGVACMVAGLTGLVVVSRWAVSRAQAHNSDSVTNTAKIDSAG